MKPTVVIVAVTLLTTVSAKVLTEDQLIAGGPGKGGIGFDRGIAALDHPHFITAKKASQFLAADDLVFGIVVGGQARAYPKKIMVWHEIANDTIKEHPVLITYCPLCGTGIAFERRVNGKPTRFGTSGKLYNSNLVMYDERTQSKWTQVDGQAVIGEMTGTKLKLIPLQSVSFGDWKREHPSTKVLSNKTGMRRNYARDPYASYYTTKRLMFGIKHEGPLHPKQMVAGLTVGDTHKAYAVALVAQRTAVNDTVAGQPLLIVVNPSTRINKGFEFNPIKIFNRRVSRRVLMFDTHDKKLIDQQTKSVWNFDGRCVRGALKGKRLERIATQSAMWFAWKKFHPDTLLYSDSKGSKLI